MERIQEILTTIDNWLWGNWLLFVLLAVGILYTVISGGVQVRHFKYIIKKTLIHPIRYGDKDTNSEGSVSSFQALNMAIARALEAEISLALQLLFWRADWARSSGCGSRHSSVWLPNMARSF